MQQYWNLLQDIPWGLFFFIAACLIAGYFVYSKKKVLEKSIAYDIIFVFLLIYSLAIVFCSIFPITYGASGLEIQQILSHNFKPFSGIADAMAKGNFGYLAFNLTALLLLPIFLNLLRLKKLNWGKLVFICFLAACGMELLQVLVNVLSHFHNHVIDIDSIILRTIGGAIGAVIASCKFVKENHFHK